MHWNCNSTAVLGCNAVRACSGCWYNTFHLPNLPHTFTVLWAMIIGPTRRFTFSTLLWKLVTGIWRKKEKQQLKERLKFCPSSTTRPLFFPLLDSLCSASWFFSLPQPNVGMLISRKLLQIYKGEFGSTSLKRGRTPTSPAGRSYFGSLRG